MAVSYTARIKVADDVMFRQLDQESVILNLNSGLYFGLDPVGTDMWQALTTADSIQSAYERLLAEYEVAPDELRSDLDELIARLITDGLLTVA